MKTNALVAKIACLLNKKKEAIEAKTGFKNVL